jgi:hypothetical protein
MSVAPEQYQAGDCVEINLARGKKSVRWVPGTVTQTNVGLSGIGGFIDNLLGWSRATVRIDQKSELYPGEEVIIVNSPNRKDVRPKAPDSET